MRISDWSSDVCSSDLIANNPDIRDGMSREEIDAAIKRHADFELLYDKPYEDRKKVRVTGPFTVESLSPHRSLSFATTSEPVAERAAAEDPDARKIGRAHVCNPITHPQRGSRMSTEKE